MDVVRFVPIDLCQSVSSVLVDEGVVSVQRLLPLSVSFVE